MDRRSTYRPCWYPWILSDSGLKGVSIDGNGLRIVIWPTDRKSVRWPTLDQFSWAEILGVSDSIDGCAGWTVGQATVRRWPRRLPLQIFLKNWFLIYFRYGVLHTFSNSKQVRICIIIVVVLWPFFIYTQSMKDSNLDWCNIVHWVTYSFYDNFTNCIFQGYTIHFTRVANLTQPLQIVEHSKSNHTSFP